jgi:endonuclease YncB( thermonuclease family)
VKLKVTLVVIILVLAWYFDPFSYRVIKVIDGDTFTYGNKFTSSRKRMHSIDAPELSQSFGIEAKDSLYRKIQGRSLKLIEQKKDARWNRDVVDVFYYGRNINLEMVTEGSAWYDPRFGKNKDLLEAQEKAKVDHKGLWKKQKPVAPWEWRKHGSKK